MKPSWSFTQGLLLGAGLMYVLDPSKSPRPGGAGRAGGRAWKRVATAAGAVAVAYGARAIGRVRAGRIEERTAPNYAYLR